MKILVTGAAGFIGSHTVKKLVELGHNTIGLDNINEYYDSKLKFARLKNLGFGDRNAIESKKMVRSETYGKALSFIKLDICDSDGLSFVFENEKFDAVCHLAAQAGVRYSLENPKAYIESNVSGFLNILECCKNYNVRHLVYASSSSVYGVNTKIPFATKDRTDNPASLYAATKKSNELMAHTYSHLFGIQTIGLRFFTVYGPWGRPDMAIYLFADAISNDRPIKVFNHGKMERDFTFIDDIVEGVVRIVTVRPSGSLHKIYNIGNGKSEKLNDFIAEIEASFGKEARKEMLPMQPGDVEKTWADTTTLAKDYNYQPSTNIKQGIRLFAEWYREYHLS